MTTVSIVEDDLPFRCLLTRALSKNTAITIASVHTTAEEAIAVIPNRRPNVVLMDLKLPAMDGVECMRRLSRLRPRLSLEMLVLTEYQDSNLVFEALKAGASGYLLKDRLVDGDICDALRHITAGGAAMSPNIARKVIQYFHPPTDSFGSLSLRETEVLANLADGLMYKEIAAKLSISLNTVRRHVGSIYSKLHVQSRAHAVRRYLLQPGMTQRCH